MLFNSPEFIFAFLPVAFLVYFGLNALRLNIIARAWLVGCNLFFYAWWTLDYLPLLLISMAFNYAVGSELGRMVRRERTRVSPKLVLAAGIAANLGALGYYKYADFALRNWDALTGQSHPALNILLPLAISFFTFQQIAYLVDSYRGETSEYNLLNYALFVSFFPQLIAGPIVHHSEMMTQFAARRNVILNKRNVLGGIIIFALGLFKKVVVADTFAGWADAGFDGAQTLDFFAAWGASLSYTFQLYFDFSGYCDMAYGAALMFNIRLPINFFSPYKALDIQDFWRRWHITLGRFLRDYVYIPLGGNRSGEFRTYQNLIVTFTLGGLWHGASWMFVIWGLMHGVALALHRGWKALGLRMPRPLAWIVTFLFVNTAWVFFRATDMASARRVLAGMVDVGSITGLRLADLPVTDLAWGGTLIGTLSRMLPAGLVAQAPVWAAIVVAFVLIACRNTYEIVTTRPSYGLTVAASVLFVIAVHVMLASTSAVFLYFNF